MKKENIWAQPEPYAGIGIIPTSVEGAQELEKWAKEKEKEIQELLNDINIAFDMRLSFSFEYITREKDGNITLVKKLSGAMISFSVKK